ncbi:MAG: hypothetical protein BMS9Abin37_2338 [Acidobacteriota bacterium]|nr:MAG: hypothetical protein BMS9Abin37_2338 [Acidobacteriota bacterium]
MKEVVNGVSGLLGTALPTDGLEGRTPTILRGTALVPTASVSDFASEHVGFSSAYSRGCVDLRADDGSAGSDLGLGRPPASTTRVSPRHDVGTAIGLGRRVPRRVPAARRLPFAFVVLHRQNADAVLGDGESVLVLR